VIVGGVSLGTFVGPRRAARRSAFSEEDAALARVINSAERALIAIICGVCGGDRLNNPT